MAKDLVAQWFSSGELSDDPFADSDEGSSEPFDGASSSVSDVATAPAAAAAIEASTAYARGDSAGAHGQQQQPHHATAILPFRHPSRTTTWDDDTTVRNTQQEASLKRSGPYGESPQDSKKTKHTSAGGGKSVHEVSDGSVHNSCGRSTPHITLQDSSEAPPRRQATKRTVGVVSPTHFKKTVVLAPAPASATASAQFYASLPNHFVPLGTQASNNEKTKSKGKGPKSKAKKSKRQVEVNIAKQLWDRHVQHHKENEKGKPSSDQVKAATAELHSELRNWFKNAEEVPSPVFVVEVQNDSTYGGVPPSWHVGDRYYLAASQDEIAAYFTRKHNFREILPPLDTEFVKQAEDRATALINDFSSASGKTSPRYDRLVDEAREFKVLVTLLFAAIKTSSHFYDPVAEDIVTTVNKAFQKLKTSSERATADAREDAFMTNNGGGRDGEGGAGASGGQGAHRRTGPGGEGNGTFGEGEGERDTGGGNAHGGSSFFGGGNHEGMQRLDLDRDCCTVSSEDTEYSDLDGSDTDDTDSGFSSDEDSDDDPDDDDGTLVIQSLFRDKEGDVHSRDIDGWTPLHHVSARGHLFYTGWLLSLGADPATRNAEGETPLDLARSRGMTKVANLLEKAIAGFPKMPLLSLGATDRNSDDGATSASSTCGATNARGSPAPSYAIQGVPEEKFHPVIHPGIAHPTNVHVLPAADSAGEELPPIYLLREESAEQAYALVDPEKFVRIGRHPANWGSILFAVVYRRVLDSSSSNVFQAPTQDAAQLVAIKQLNKKEVAKYLRSGGEDNPYKDIDRMQRLGDDYHVLRCIEALEDDEHLYIVTPKGEVTLIDEMQWLGGKTMHPSRAKNIFCKLLKILAYLERHGLCHGNLSPESILFLMPNNPVVFDLGMSHSLTTTGTRRNSTAQHANYYMTPEIYSHSKNRQTVLSGHRGSVDLWSAAVILYNLLTNQILYYQPLAVDISYAYNILAHGLSSNPINTHAVQFLQDSVASEKEGTTTDDDHGDQKTILREFCRRAMANLSLSGEAAELLEHIIHPNPRKRWTLSQARESAYVAQ